MFGTPHFWDGLGAGGAVVGVIGEAELWISGKSVGTCDFDNGVDDDGPPSFEGRGSEERGLAE